MMVPTSLEDVQQTRDGERWHGVSEPSVLYVPAHDDDDAVICYLFK